MSTLRPCAVCARHVRSGAEWCPFCGAAVVPGPPLSALRHGRRIARATVAAVGLTASQLACDTTDQGTADGGVVAADASDARAAVDLGFAVGDAYGVPPDAEPAVDQGVVAGDAYGVPADAEPAVDQGIVAGDAYGAPPDAS